MAPPAGRGMAAVARARCGPAAAETGADGAFRLGGSTRAMRPDRGGGGTPSGTARPSLARAPPEEVAEALALGPVGERGLPPPAHDFFFAFSDM